MNTAPLILETVLEQSSQPSAIQRGFVLETSQDGSVTITSGQSDDETLRCDILQTSELPLRLERGDTVLVWKPAGQSRGVILGRIGAPNRSRRQAGPRDQTPDELVIEAGQRLVLKCGDAAMTLREDGKVLIQGKDLVSKAQRMNRVKGGAVAIN